MAPSGNILPKRAVHSFTSAYTKLFHAPNIRLRLAEYKAPNYSIVATILLFGAYFIYSGIFYDIINGPPSIGQERDERTGEYYPSVIARQGMSSQYVFEGLSAGFLFMLGGLGFILLSYPNFNALLSGAIIVPIAYLMLSQFMRQKQPGYPY
ncbi:putative Oligosaccharyl transferase complex, subunit OST3/OST6 [Blattamonas nauphoetae]|uniref:Oligosaccharyl transferase complex, subunit OST3/OST6 n=1 Tax=Blattamonas nauphoetae TaxID=2049346 RepID=A0ABQ9YKD6_9EUKA|nr:putative Oligosaccharyl transferase complex, subunit OST3/OST6 [Blattamonas nauphoetae]